MLGQSIYAYIWRTIRARDPEVVVALGARSKQPGQAMTVEPVELFVCHQPGDESQAYERLIGDAIRGAATLFVRRGEVESAWRAVDPVLGERTPLHEYEPRSRRPPAAGRVIAVHGGWHAPSSDAPAPLAAAAEL